MNPSYNNRYQPSSASYMSASQQAALASRTSTSQPSAPASYLSTQASQAANYQQLVNCYIDQEGKPWIERKTLQTLQLHRYQRQLTTFGGMAPTHQAQSVSSSMPAENFNVHAQGRGLPPATYNVNAQGGMPPATYNVNAQGGMLPVTYNVNAQGGMPPVTYNVNAQGRGMPSSTNVHTNDEGPYTTTAQNIPGPVYGQPMPTAPTAAPDDGSSMVPERRTNEEYPECSVKLQMIRTHAPSRILTIPKNRVRQKVLPHSPYHLPSTQCPFVYPDGIQCTEMAKKKKGTQWNQSKMHWDMHRREELQWMTLNPEFIGRGTIITSPALFERHRHELALPTLTPDEFIAHYNL